jgi:hypothetical protein
MTWRRTGALVGGACRRCEAAGVLRRPRGVIDWASFRVGSVNLLEDLLDLGTGMATMTSGRESAAVGGPGAQDLVHRLLDRAQPTWPGLPMHVIVDVDDEGIRLLPRCRHGGRGDDFAGVAFGTFWCSLHHYSLRITLTCGRDNGRRPRRSGSAADTMRRATRSERRQRPASTRKWAQSTPR